MQQNNLDVLFTTSQYSGNLAYSQRVDYRTVYTPKKRPEILRPVKKKVPAKKKSFNFVTFLFTLAVTAFVACLILPFTFKNFTAPIFENPEKTQLRVNMQHIYSPTSKYLHNNEFLGVHFLQGAELQAPAMQQLEMTSEMTGLENQLNILMQQYPTIHPSIFVWDYETGKYAAQSGIDLLVCVGTLAKHIYDGAVHTIAKQNADAKEEKQMKVCYYATKEEAVSALPEMLEQGDTVLVKASHGMHFEEIDQSIK